MGARKDDGYFIFVSLDSYVGANNSKNILVYDITITFMGVINPLITRGPHCIMCVCVFCGILFFVPEKDALQATNSYFRISMDFLGPCVPIGAEIHTRYS